MTFSHYAQTGKSKLKEEEQYSNTKTNNEHNTSDFIFVLKKREESSSPTHFQYELITEAEKGKDKDVGKYEEKRIKNKKNN